MKRRGGKATRRGLPITWDRPANPWRTRLFEELLLSDLEFRTRDEATLDTGEYLSQYPDRATQIRDVIDRFWSEYGVGRSSPCVGQPRAA